LLDPGGVGYLGLEVPKKKKRESTCLAAFLSCLLCVFALPETGDRLICLETFETASLMASSCTFSLAVLVLASPCRGSNRIAHAAKPSYSRSFFPCHYLYGWLAHYFQTHHMLHRAPLGPLMVRYSGPLTAHGKIGDARKLIHQGKGLELGCPILAKNHAEIILDDRKLDDNRSDYLVALRDGFLPIHRGASLHVEPYSPHRFSRQFGFYQRIPRYFWMILALEQCHMRTPFTTGRDFHS